MDLLPIELVTLIAVDTFELFTTLLRVPTIGVLLCSPYAQLYAKEKFIKKVFLNTDSYATLLNNRFHSFDDQPAVVYGEQIKMWYKYGLKHRDGDKPAHFSATIKYYKNGHKHRDGDLPAVICPDMSMHWYRNGTRHRDGDQPAIVYTSGVKYWYWNGFKHRVGGPAITGIFGYDVYMLYASLLT